MGKDPEIRVHDRVALEEIELYAELLEAVAAINRRLTTEELDHVLGLHPEPLASGPPARVLTSVRAGHVAERRAQSRVERRTPSMVQRHTTPVSPAQVYRQALQQAAADESPHDVRAGLERLLQWMTQEPDNDTGHAP